jgi:hypothetical protein
MSGLGLHLAAALALTSAAGVAMSRLGSSLHVLRSRDERHCPACGRRLERGACARCTR